MKYYLIVGEASGDLNASNFMCALIPADPEAEPAAETQAEKTVPEEK